MIVNVIFCIRPNNGYKFHLNANIIISIQFCIHCFVAEPTNLIPYKPNPILMYPIVFTFALCIVHRYDDRHIELSRVDLIKKNNREKERDDHVYLYSVKVAVL